MTTTDRRRDGRWSSRGLTGLRAAAAAAAITAVTGLGALTYANQVGLKKFTLRRVSVPVAGVPTSLRILHISDIHYVPGQQEKFRWLQELAELQPDLVINTGDNLSHHRAVPEVLEALAPLREFPGAFVPGSNDYYAPKLKNPLRYLLGPSTLDPEAQVLPTDALFGGFESLGWANLSNAHAAVRINGLSLHLSGVDDPHIGRDEFTGWPETADRSQTPDLRIAVAHAPVLRVLETFVDARADLVLAGHTHGGQVCLPGERAIVTNCDLPRRYAKGLHYRRGSHGENIAVHVSAGIGTSAKAPIRLNCPPEATLLEITPA
ncbi:metallophosphoesterase [Nesterenkonia massiliensis]|uniref:metallophosphoesterase n=1 Tax=Nesterenkonia massiliensis TaxID=1232429 RepID=UPI000419DE14|nr:metallophosphoesterase [Nesterenkonia massiliensis]